MSHGLAAPAQVPSGTQLDLSDGMWPGFCCSPHPWPGLMPVLASRRHITSTSSVPDPLEGRGAHGRLSET